MKDCICSIKCRVAGCGKQHHILPDLESPGQATVNFMNIQDFTKTYSANTAVVDALIDSGSDATLITSKLAKTLKIKGKQRKLNVPSAVSTSFSVTLKLVEF